MILRELREVLVNVEDDRDGDNQGDGIEISAYELLYDIPVENLQIAFRVEIFHPTQILCRPFHCVYNGSKGVLYRPNCL